MYVFGGVTQAIAATKKETKLTAVVQGGCVVSDKSSYSQQHTNPTCYQADLMDVCGNFALGGHTTLLLKSGA